MAGYARVLLPVRNGYEDSINFYMLTGRPWMGGSLPSICDRTQNPLYMSIMEEQKKQNYALGDEIFYGDSWEFRVPTAISKLRKEKPESRKNDKLPEWELKDPKEKWIWEEIID